MLLSPRLERDSTVETSFPHTIHFVIPRRATKIGPASTESKRTMQPSRQVRPQIDTTAPQPPRCTRSRSVNWLAKPKKLLLEVLVSLAQLVSYGKWCKALRARQQKPSHHSLTADNIDGRNCLFVAT